MPLSRRLSLVGALFATTVIALPVAAQDDAKAQFEARYAALRTAMSAHDTAAVGKILAPEYQMTDMRGETRSGAEMIERMSKMAARAPDPSRKVETKVISVTVTGDTATVDQQLVGGGKRMGDDGAEHTMEMVMSNTDTWSKRGDAWLLVKSVQTGMTIKRDGEVFFQEGK